MKYKTAGTHPCVTAERGPRTPTRVRPGVRHVRLLVSRGMDVRHAGKAHETQTGIMFLDVAVPILQSWRKQVLGSR